MFVLSEKDVFYNEFKEEIYKKFSSLTKLGKKIDLSAIVKGSLFEVEGTEYINCGTIAEEYKVEREACTTLEGTISLASFLDTIGLYNSFFNRKDSKVEDYFDVILPRNYSFAKTSMDEGLKNKIIHIALPERMLELAKIKTNAFYYIGTANRPDKELKIPKSERVLYDEIIVIQGKKKKLYIGVW